MESLRSVLVPKDTYSIVFIIFLVNGIGTLFPWNMLINADNYFTNYKLNVTNPSPAVDDYRHHFLSYLGIASKAPNIFLQILNMFINAENANLSLRIKITLGGQILVFLFIIACAAVDSSSWPGLFFWLTMASAATINLANGVYQGCVYGLAARFPMSYINSVSIGMNISGTIAALFMILSIAVSPNASMEAIVFFSFAAVLLGVCLIAEFYLVTNTFYKFYAHGRSETEKLELEEPDAPPVESKVPAVADESLASRGVFSTYLFILGRIWLQLVNLILIYGVSLSIFPAVAARVPSVDGILSPTYYLPVFCFLFFNLFATVGNFTAQYVQWPSAQWLIIVAVVRLVFVPFFLYCNYHPSDTWARTWPVYFDHDWMYILGMVVFAWSSGYTSSLAMMYIPRLVPAAQSATAGMLGALTIILGILIGINVSLIYPRLFSDN